MNLYDNINIIGETTILVPQVWSEHNKAKLELSFIV